MGYGVCGFRYGVGKFNPQYTHVQPYAYGIKEEDIPAELYVNSDQTHVVYVQGSKLTWTTTGSHQVTIIREDEKRAFTIVVSVLK